MILKPTQTFLTDSYDEKLEDFITMRVIVDCYDDYEVASSWYSFLSNHLHFPFAARIRRTTSTQYDKVTASRLEDEEECEEGIMVEVRSARGALMSVQLEALELTQTHAEREQALRVWTYWVNQGYSYDTAYLDEEG